MVSSPLLALLRQEVPVPPAPPVPPDIPPEVLAWLQQVPPQMVVLIPLAVIVIGGVILVTLVRAIARRIEGGGGVRELRAELELLRNRLSEMEEGQARLAELEERLDFHERVLAQGQREQAERR